MRVTARSHPRWASEMSALLLSLVAVGLSSCNSKPSSSPTNTELEVLRIKAAGADSSERENADLRRQIAGLEARLRECTPASSASTETFTPITVPSPTPPQAPTVAAREADAQPVVTKAEAKATESNKTWTRFSWNVTVSNPSNATVRASVGVEFLDAGGFVVDDDTASTVQIGAGQTMTVRDYDLVTASVAPTVASVRGTIEVRR
jgi:hypothetical protein